MPAQFRLYIVRHGETEWNRTHRIQGQLDVPLNEAGVKQAVLVAEALKGVPFVRAFSSDLQRASKTAECILRYHPDVVLEMDESIRERYMGESQGKIGPLKQPALSMEKTPDFVARCLAWYLESIVDQAFSTIDSGHPMDRPRDILVVSHGGWISTLLLALRANELMVCREDVEMGHYSNTGVSIIEYPEIPTAGRDKVLVGTLVQYSSAEHLACYDLNTQEMNVDLVRG